MSETFSLAYCKAHLSELVLSVVLVAIVAMVFANLVGAIVGGMAAQTRTAIALRSE